MENKENGKNQVNVEIPFELTSQIIAAAMEVHSQMRPGFNEYVYQDALAHEFFLRGIPYEKEVPLPVFYKGKRLLHYYQADFVCYGKIIVEVKALPAIGRKEESQLLAYLKATGFRKGLIFNFGEPSFKFVTRVN